ncbi:MAG: metal-dependent transcriptional regulator [Verrucomicrobiota bacterium]
MTEVPTPQQEDYLEAIAALLRSDGVARVGAIAERVGVHKSTVTAALHALSHRGWVNYHPYESVTLTPDGEVLAARVQRRHTIIERFLRDLLCLEEEQAARNACRLEHAVDADVTNRLVQFMKFLDETEPEFGAVVRRFNAYCSDLEASDGTPEQTSDSN